MTNFWSRKITIKKVFNSIFEHSDNIVFIGILLSLITCILISMRINIPVYFVIIYGLIIFASIMTMLIATVLGIKKIQLLYKKINFYLAIAVFVFNIFLGIVWVNIN